MYYYIIQLLKYYKLIEIMNSASSRKIMQKRMSIKQDLADIIKLKRVSSLSRISQSLPNIKQEQSQTLAKNMSFSLLVDYLNTSLESCPLKKRKNKVIRVGRYDSKVDISGLVSPKSGQANILPAEIFRKTSIKTAKVTSPLNSLCKKAKKGLIQYQNVSPFKQKEIEITAQIVPYNNVDTEEWDRRTKLLEILQDYRDVEGKRKQALHCLHKSATSTELYENTLNCWYDVIERSEEKYKFTEHAFPILYAVYKVLADISLLFRRTEEAIQIYEYVLLYAKTKYAKELILTLYGQLAYCFHLLQEYEASLYYYQKQLKLACFMKNQQVEAQVYDLMGIEYYYLGDIERSKYYHDLSMNWGTASRFMQNSDFSWMNNDNSKEGINSKIMENDDNYENRYLNKMKYIRSKGFSADLTESMLKIIKTKVNGISYQALNLKLYTVLSGYKSMQNSPKPNTTVNSQVSSPRSTQTRFVIHKKSKTGSKIDLALRPYKMKLQAVRKLLEKSKDTYSTTYKNVPTFSDYNKLNFNSYTHLSQLRHLQNGSNLKTVVAKITGRMEEFKQILIKEIFKEIDKQELADCYKTVLTECV